MAKDQVTLVRPNLFQLSCHQNHGGGKRHVSYLKHSGPPTPQFPQGPPHLTCQDTGLSHYLVCGPIRIIAKRSRAMTNLQLEKRHSRDHKAHLEYLDNRIVPSTVQLNLMPAEVATVHASVQSAQHHEESATAESRIEIRRENRMAEIAERREKALERREARAERIAARHQFSPAVVPESPARQLAAAISTTGAGASGSGQSTGGSPPSGSSTGPGGISSTTMPVTTTPITTAPVSTTPITTAPVLTTPVTTTPVTTTPITTAPVSTTPVTTSPTSASLPLPANASTLLATVYQEFQNGDLPTTNEPGQVEIQGINVGIQIHSSDPTDFASMVANAENLGLQVTIESDSFDIVVGFLPISNLPAIAQLSGSPSITPVFTPQLNLN